MPTDAARAIADYRAAGQRHAEAVGREMELEHRRPVVKHDAIIRLMTGENELTHKAHSATSAEQIVEADAGYAAHLTALRAATVARYAAGTEARAAELEAMLALTQAATEPLEVLR